MSEHFPAPNPEDRIPSQEIPLSMQLDPTVAFDLEDFDPWGLGSAEDSTEVPVSTEKKSLSYKAGYFIGKHLGGKLIKKSAEVDFSLPISEENPESYETDDLFEPKSTESTVSFEQPSLTENEPAWVQKWESWDVEPTDQEDAVAEVLPVVEPLTHVIDDEQLALAGEAVTPETAARSLEINRVVKEAPRLSDIIADESRDNPIRHFRGYRASGGHEPHNQEDEFMLTERESVQELADFLTQVSEIETVDMFQEQYIETAHDMLKNLTFIGYKERQEAMNGIAEYWKVHLRANEDAQICALAAISHEGKVKSDQFLLDGILSQFSDDELSEFGDRLVTSLGEITADPKDTKIIMLDDWVISGSQMNEAYLSKIHNNPKMAQYAESVEIQLVTSTDARLEKGLKVGDYFGDRTIRYVPVRSYFRSHTAEQSTDYAFNDHQAYETGSHSSVDYDFENSYIQNMLSIINGWEATDASKQRMPGATRIIREYRNNPLDNIRRLNVARVGRQLEEARNRDHKQPVGADTTSGYSYEL